MLFAAAAFPREVRLRVGVVHLGEEDINKNVFVAMDPS